VATKYGAKAGFDNDMDVTSVPINSTSQDNTAPWSTPSGEHSMTVSV